MQAPWAIEEMKTAALNDKRLNDRLTTLLSQLGGRPTASIPEACGGYAEMTAAYRFFDNDRVGFDDVLQPHIDATRLRIAGQPVVILAQDTTEIDVTRPEQQVAGAGPLDGSARRGVFLHPLHAFTPDGTPLGTIHATVMIRAEEPPAPAPKTRSERQHEPIEEKESYRWVATLQQAKEAARRAPHTRIVAVADSEADIYELLAEAQAEPCDIDWIVRACQNRALAKRAAKTKQKNSASGAVAESAMNHLRERVLQSEVLFTQTIQVRGRKAKVGCEKRGRRQSRESRAALVEVRAAQVVLRAPWRPDRKLPDLVLNVVLVRELDPPPDEPAVEWMLLTNLPIDTIEQVRLAIQYYCVRWVIEIFFRTLKSGCRVEARRFERVDRLLPCLAVYLIVTWRTLYVCRLGRAFPDIDCEAVFEPAEWKSVYQFLHHCPPPAKPPTLAEMVRLVAQLGGYVNRKRPDPPGPQTVWLGLQRTHDITTCWLAFGPEAQKKGRDV